MVSVVVIGASAAGLMAALKISSAGIDTILLEGQTNIGSSPADTIMSSMLDKCDIKIPTKSIIHKVDGFRVFSPSGKSIKFINAGFKIDRSVFDEYFLSKIKKNGGEVHFGVKVEKIKNNIDNITVYASKNGKNERFSCDILVVASGVKNPYLTGFSPMKYPNDVAYSYQVDMEDVNIDPNYFEFYIGNNFAPGWKAAISPYSDSKGSIGIYARGIKNGDEKICFKNFLTSSPATSKIKDGNIIKSFYGLDPIVTIPNQLVYQNIVVVGCAGGQSGLAYGMAAGEIAGETIADSKGDLSYLKNYEQYWKNNFMKDYIMGRLVLQLLYKLSDVDIDKLFEILLEIQLGSKNISFMQGFKMGGFLLKKYPKLFFRVINITLQNTLM